MKDLQIREELNRNYLSPFRTDSNTRIIEELGLNQGSVRIDVAVINGSLVGFEIKSEQDDLKRLPAQMEMYNKIFDYIYIVANEKHLPAIKEKVPDFWGIVRVEKFETGFKLDTVRQPIRNQNSDPYFLAQLLWKDEVLDILERTGFAAGMKSKNRHQLWTKFSGSFSKEKVNEYVREYIKKRPEWRQSAA
jgi:hypothetical protein